MTGHSFHTMILASTNKEWFSNDPSKSEDLQSAGNCFESPFAQNQRKS